MHLARVGWRTIGAFLRLPTYLLMVMYCLLGYTMALGLTWGMNASTHLAAEAWKLGLALVAIAAWYINATAINDLADVQIDKENLKGDASRPLVTGAAGHKEVRIIAAAGALMALMVVVPLGLAATLLMALMLGFNAVYSLPPVRMSWRGGLALTLLPLGYVGLTMGLGSLAAGVDLAPSLLVLIAVCYIQFVARISLKDYRDVIGDQRYGKRTFLIRHGSGAVVKLALTCHIIASLASAMWLYQISVPLAAGFISIASAAGVFLTNLRSTNNWPQQRPWISSYGRLVSGQVALLLVGSLMLAGAVTGNRPNPVILSALITGTFLWSAAQVVRRLGPQSHSR